MKTAIAYSIRSTNSIARKLYPGRIAEQTKILDSNLEKILASFLGGLLGDTPLGWYLGSAAPTPRERREVMAAYSERRLEMERTT